MHYWVSVGILVTWRYSDGCPVFKELCSSLCFYEVKSTNLKMILSFCWDGVKNWHWVRAASVTSLVCVCVRAQGGLVDNIEQRVQESQDYVERAKDFIPKCKKFKKTSKRVRRNANTSSAQLTLSCLFLSSRPPLLLLSCPLLSGPPLFLNSSSFVFPFYPSSSDCPPRHLASPLSLAPCLRALHTSSATNLFLGGNDRPHRVQCGALGRLCGEGSVRH